MRVHRPVCVVLLGLLAARSDASQPLPRGQEIASVVGEGPLRNTTPLPSLRAAEEALARGDATWAEALGGAAGDRPGARNRAFDAWHDALTASRPGDAVRLDPDDGAPRPWRLPDPDGTHARRSEDVAAAVQRRIGTLDQADRAAWQARFGPRADADLRRELTRPEPSLDGLGDVERVYPATEAAARAALAMTDLELERARPSAAAVWLARARRHVALAAGPDPDGGRVAVAGRIVVAMDRRAAVVEARLARVFVGDHSRIQPELPAQGPAAARGAAETAGLGLRLVAQLRISGLVRTPDEPYGRDLGSGVAFFSDGVPLVQGAHGLLLTTRGRATRKAEDVRERLDVLFGTARPLVRAAASAGGWKAYPATDGTRMALVIGRGERRRPFLEIPVPPAGNALGLLARGEGDRSLEPLWVLRDGILVERPAPKRVVRDVPVVGGGGDGGRVDGWSFGRGWEFQPGPVFVDDVLFALARGIGDATNDGDDHADELRLFALDVATGAVRWSRDLTKERGLLDPSQRGRAAFFATTSMPLNVDRRSGHVLIGTNVGLLCAYDVADGRLAWALRSQRREASQSGWPGSRPPLLVGGADERTAWFTPFDSEFAYALPSGPAPLDGGLFREPPRARRGALDLAAVRPGSAAAGDDGRSSLVLLGRDGRHAAVLLEGPEGVRRPATYLAPDERFAGRPAIAGAGLLVAGTRELGLLSLEADLRLVDAEAIPSEGAGRGGDVVLFGDRIHVVGRDTIWIWDRP